MKYTQVSESALNTIQSMAVDREQEIIRLKDALMDIRILCDKNLLQDDWAIVSEMALNALKCG